MTSAVVALGANLGPRRRTLDGAVADLGRLPGTRVVAVSRWIETAPVDAPEGSPPFLNGAALLETSLDPRALLSGLKDVEQKHGRRRGEHNAPRTLDLDLILHGDAVLNETELVLPHPRAHERDFVLGPAADVAPHLVHPLLGQDLRALNAALQGTGA